MYVTGDKTWRFDTRDLMRVSLCEHCTTVSVLRSLKVPGAMSVLQPYIDAQMAARANGEDETLAIKYGKKFETQIENELIASLPEGSVQRPKGDFAGAEERAAATKALMIQGVPIIYQGGLMHRDSATEFSGMPDFLVRGDWRLEFLAGKLTATQTGNSAEASLYAAWDAKYARSAKPEYSLQVAIYLEALDSMGLKSSGPHGVILGSRTLEIFDESEILPAMRLARETLALSISSLDGEPLEKLEARAASFTWHCDKAGSCKICEYPDLCTDSRARTDDLSLVHNIKHVHRVHLCNSGITTLTDLAKAKPEDRPVKVPDQIWGRLQMQAAAQLEARQTGNPVSWSLPDPQLQFLPPSHPADVFFDLEGFQFHSEPGGLEYLFGCLPRNEQFVWFWADNRAEEKVAFDDFMGWLIPRLQSNPQARVYHYGHYEKSALRNLADRHSIRGDEVTWLERENKLVDLQPMVRNSMVVGEESYSIKKLERHYGYNRSAEVKKASDSMDGYEEYLSLLDAARNEGLTPEDRRQAQAEANATKQVLLDYNFEDVESTMALTNWLASMPGACSRFGENEGPKDVDGAPTAADLRLQELQEKTAELFAPLEGWQFGRDSKLDLNALAWGALTHSILFYQREQVTFWTDLYIRLAKEDFELESDRKAEALTNVVEVGRSSRTSRDGREIHSAQYEATLNPEGLFQPSPDDDLVIRFMRAGNVPDWAFGKVTAVANGKISFTRQIQPDDEKYLPNAIFEYAKFNISTKQQALNDLADEVISEWKHPSLPAPENNAAVDLLLRRPPRLVGGGPLPQAKPEDFLGPLTEAIDRMDKTALAVQGPPGSGKTYLASHLIAHLLGQGKRVAVATTSHKACENLLEACVAAGVDESNIFKAPKTGDKQSRPWNTPRDNADLGKKLATHRGAVLVGGTAWTFCNTRVISNHFDYLFIDEAAQFSMVDALAVSRAAENLVLLGDPRQLPQVVTAIHPGGVENSALGHYMGEHAILPAELGYFVDVTRRLHPAVNAPVSWLAYQGRLHSHPGTEDHVVSGIKPGLHFVPVVHEGNSTRSIEEVETVADLVVDLTKSLAPQEILVVTPYNAQVDAIRKALDDLELQAIEVGTVDKFQGREAMAVVISLAASCADDAPRGLEFLLDRNRLNVAISRAKSVCFLVHSPELTTGGFNNLADLKAISRLVGLKKFDAAG